MGTQLLAKGLPAWELLLTFTFELWATCSTCEGNTVTIALQTRRPMWHRCSCTASTCLLSVQSCTSHICVPALQSQHKLFARFLFFSSLGRTDHPKSLGQSIPTILCLWIGPRTATEMTVLHPPWQSAQSCNCLQVSGSSVCSWYTLHFTSCFSTLQAIESCGSCFL